MEDGSNERGMRLSGTFGPGCGCEICCGNFRAEAVGNQEEGGSGLPRTPIADFSTSDFKWGPSGAAGSTGGIVTWSIAGAGLTTPSAGFFTGSTVDPASILTFDYRAQIKAALNAWSQVASIKFVEVADSNTALGTGLTGDLRIAMGYIDGDSNVLGRGNFPPYLGNGNRIAISGDLVLDSGDTWTLSEFYFVMLHEFGHTLGLDHEDGVDAVMNAYANFPLYGTGPYGTALQTDDINGIVAMYGAGPYAGPLTYDMPSSQVSLILAEAVNGLRINGNSQANQIIGTAADEIFDGGTGNDAVLGGLGNDVYYHNSISDVAGENLNAGNDSVIATVNLILGANIENGFVTGSAALGVLGNDLANVIYGNTGNNGLAGGAGNDSIYGEAGADSMDGQAGADSMSGGAGIDTYFVDNFGDTVTEIAEAGVFDTVWTTVAFILPANV
ncbi:MAG: matrixin family metalloprotease, partial [Bosea sp. (in: a-proteobacteria)]